MGWMKACYIDAMQLQDFMAESLEKDPGDLSIELQVERGWVCPTVSGLARTLISEVMERVPLNDEDTKQMERVIGLLGTGE